MTDFIDIPPPPEPPEDYECCDSGCEEMCVFEIYRREKAEYDAKYGTLTRTTDGTSHD
ncbi:MAG: oxidoreductase-like domain-containing protein [Moraxella sp.]|nr:oxidoreductase-like domain-containing protein [Moraxella sp.]